MIARILPQARGQIGAGRVDGGLDVARGAVDVAVETELQGDARVAERTLRGHLGQVGDLAEMALQGRGDVAGHVVGARARHVGLNEDRREIDLRQRRDRQLPERQQPRERDADRQQDRRDRPPDEQGGEAAVHEASGAAAPLCGGEAERRAEPLEIEIDDRRRIERQRLAERQTADDGQAQRSPQLRADAVTEHQRQRAEHRRHRRHQDRAQAQQAGLIDRLARRQPLDALRFEGEVDHHDRVLLDDAYQQHDADDADDVEPGAGRVEREQRADAGRRQRRENRDRMDEALVEHAEHDIHGHDGGREQEQFVRQRGLERLRRALEGDLKARRQTEAGKRPS